MKGKKGLSWFFIHNFSVCFCGLRFAYDEFEMDTTIVTEWNLVCDNAWQVLYQTYTKLTNIFIFITIMVSKNLKIVIKSLEWIILLKLRGI